MRTNCSGIIDWGIQEEDATSNKKRHLFGSAFQHGPLGYDAGGGSGGPKGDLLSSRLESFPCASRSSCWAASRLRCWKSRISRILFFSKSLMNGSASFSSIWAMSWLL